MFDELRSGWSNYYEAGLLRLGDGKEFEVEQRYVYREMPDGFAVFFKEKPLRLFHTVRLQRLENGCLYGKGAHLCSEDSYKSEYAFGPDENFSIRHRVHGPRKNYVIETRYVPMALT